MMWGYDYSWPMMLWMTLWNLAWLVLLGLAIWALVRWLIRSASPSKHQDFSPAEPSALRFCSDATLVERLTLLPLNRCANAWKRQPRAKGREICNRHKV